MTQILNRFQNNPVVVINKDPGKTQQHFKEQCDINAVIKRYTKTGIMQSTPSASKRIASFGDFSQPTDYGTAVEKVNSANKAFMELPSTIRAKFRNNPANFLAWMDDARNLDEAVSLGLAEKVILAPVSSTPNTPPAEKVET